MSLWRVVYRNTRGAKESQEIDAPDRSQLFKKLDSLGINAISVSPVQEVSNKKKIPCAKSIIFVCIALFTALYIIYNESDVFNVEAPSNPTDKQSVLKKERIISKQTPKLPPTIQNKNEVKTPEGGRMERGVLVKSSTVITNSNGSIIENLLLSDGRKIMKVSPPEPVFKNPSDQLIAMALSVKPGQSMPPFPNMKGIDDDFKRSLNEPIVITDKDTDKIKELKSLVMEARAYLQKEIKNGGSVLEALLSYQKELEQISDHHLMAIQEINSIKKTEGIDAAREFAQKINEAFRLRGIPEVSLPSPKKQKE